MTLAVFTRSFAAADDARERRAHDLRGHRADAPDLAAPADHETPTTSARPPYARDLASSASVLAFASALWQAWGSATAPRSVGAAMVVALVVGIAVGVIAQLTRRRTPTDSLHSGAVLRSWWMWLGIEVVAIFVGNMILGLAGHAEYVICWTHLVMALHFIPLGRSYGIGLLNVSAALGAVIAVAGALGMALAGIPAGPVVGGLGGLAMVGVAIAMIVRARALTRAGATA